MTDTLTMPPKVTWKGGVAPMKARLGQTYDVVFFALRMRLLFLGLLVAYGMVRYIHPAYEGLRSQFTFSDLWWPIPEQVFNAMPFFHGISLPLLFVSIMTFILILSSVTMVLAVEAGERNDQARRDQMASVDNFRWDCVSKLSGLGMDALYYRRWHRHTFIQRRDFFRSKFIRQPIRSDDLC